MKSGLTFMAACALLLVVWQTSTLTVAQPFELSTASEMTIPENWKAVDQPQLESELLNAKMLPVQDLGTAVYGVDVAGTNLVHNPDGSGYDVLVWYRKQYKQSTRVHIVDLGSGEVRKQEFPEQEDRARSRWR